MCGIAVGKFREHDENTLKKNALSVLPRIFTGSLAVNIYSLYFAQGLNYFLPLVVLPYLVRVLGPRDYGSIAFAQSLMMYGAILTDFGFNFSATRAITLSRSNVWEVSRIFWSTLSAKVLLLVLFFILVVVSTASSEVLRAHVAVIALCSVTVVGSVLSPQWYFQGMEKLQVMAGIQAVTRICVLSLVFVLVKSPKDTPLAAILLSGPALVAGAICLVAARRIGTLHVYRPSLGDIRKSIVSSWDLFVANVATSAYVAGNGFILGFVAGDRAVALYTVANKASLAAFYLFVPVSLAVFPRASLLFSRSIEEGKAFVLKIAIPLLIGAAIVSGVLVTFSTPIVDVLGGAKFSGASTVLRVMGVLPLLLSIATVLAQIIMINIGMAKKLRRIYVGMALLSLIMLPALGGALGATGGAISLVVVEAIGPMLMIVVLYKAGFFRPGGSLVLGE